MLAKPLPSSAVLHAALQYDAVMGRLIWRHRADKSAAWNGRFAGQVAGYRGAKRCMVMIDCERYFASRVIFKMLHGYEPPMVDHRNRDKTDNSPANLRAATRDQNGANSKSRTRPVHDLPRGVFVSSSKSKPYRAKIGGRHIGMYATAAEANAAFVAAARAQYGEFSNA